MPSRVRSLAAERSHSATDVRTFKTSRPAALRVAADPSQATPDGAQRFDSVGEALAHWTTIPVEERPGIIQIDDSSTYRDRTSLQDVSAGIPHSVRIIASSLRTPAA